MRFGSAGREKGLDSCEDEWIRVAIGKAWLKQARAEDLEEGKEVGYVNS